MQFLFWAIFHVITINSQNTHPKGTSGLPQFLMFVAIFTATMKILISQGTRG